MGDGERSERSSHVWAATLLGFSALFLYALPAIFGRALTETPEARVAVVAREMLQNNEFIIPTLGGKYRLIKPPLPYWITAAIARLRAGSSTPSETILSQSVQFASALFGAFTIFLVVFSGSLALGRNAGILAGVVLCTATLPTYFAQIGYCDTILTFFCTGVFLGTAWILALDNPPSWLAIASGVCLGLGILAKWILPIGFLLPPIIFEIYLRRGLSRRKTTSLVIMFAASAAVAIPWFVFVERRMPGAWGKVIDGIVYSVRPLAHIPANRWTHYFEKLIAGMLPWTPLLIFAYLLYRKKATNKLLTTTPSHSGQREHLRFLIVIFVLGFLVLYSQAKQERHYLLPLLPPLALVAGYLLSRFSIPNGREERILGNAVALSGIILGIALLSVPYWVHKLALIPAGAASPFTSSNVLWSVCIGAGLLTTAIVFHSARQWRKGNTVFAGLLLAAPMYCGLLGWSWQRASKSQNETALYRESARLRAALELEDKDTTVYATGASDALLVFYLGRPIRTLRELALERVGQIGDQAPKRILVATSDSVQKLDISPPSATSEFFVMRLASDIDWPRKVKPHLAKMKILEDTAGDE